MIELKKAQNSSPILTLLMVAFALRLYNVSSVPLNIDEITTIIKYVPLPLLDIFTTYDSNNHSLASALAHLFSPQADHLFMLRWPFILLGMLSLPFVYRLGAGLFGRNTGLLALLLVSTSPVHVSYSTVVRGYIGLITLTTFSLYCLWQALRLNRRRHWLGVLLANILIVYFHLFGGILAAGTQLGLVGLGLLWQISRQGARSAKLRSRLNRFGLTLVILALAYMLPLYLRASSIILNERWFESEFEVWQDGLISWRDLSPFTTFIGLMAPLSPAGVGQVVYLVFAAVGLIALWFRQRILAGGWLAWFFSPFGAIFMAVQILGPAFFAYVRFLLYLLPAFLLLVALGMVTAVEKASALGQKRQWPAAYSTIKWGAGAGLLSLLVTSVIWSALVSTPIDWLALANTLSTHLQPHDITICEEHQRGFTAPDRARAYCLWMLDSLVSPLRGQTYTPRFQNSTDFVASYVHLLEQRLAVGQSGGVWLILWRKIPFRSDQLLTDENLSPPLPPLAAFEPYPAWQFGSAILIHIATEETLLGNIYKAVELLLQVEPQPADQARYYRSLAELEAVQGRRQPALDFFDQSWRLVKQAGQQYPEIFLAETQPLITRIPASQPPPETAFKLGYRFGASLCLQHYQVSPDRLNTGQALKLALYWQTIDFMPENYTFLVRLKAETGQFQTDLEFQPFDGTYPTPWWWAGQQLTEGREFYLPPDLPRQDYSVSLGAYDSRSPGQVETVPLFLMRYQADTAGASSWRIEPAAPPLNAACLQAQ